MGLTLNSTEEEFEVWRKEKIDGLEQRNERLKKEADEDIWSDREVRRQFLENTSGKEKNWAWATELLTQWILRQKKIYTTKQDEKNEMWVYKEGIYIPHGRSEVKEMLRRLLGTHYSQFVYGHVINKIEPDTFIDEESFFTTNNKEEIALENGILNTSTLVLREFTPNTIFFNKLPVKFDIAAGCEEIDKFLSQVLSKEEDKKIFYEICGDALSKENSTEKAVMFIGHGRNGKGKSIELMKRLVGAENCTSIPLVSLTPESFAISELFGKMFNLAGDIGSQDLKDTSLFKSLTGRDLVTGKRKFLRNIHFENYAKFIFACNELPMVYDLSKGFWDRWILLEFPYYFADKEEYDRTPEELRKNWKIKDENIINKIATPKEMSGLLNQALLGLQRLRQNHKYSTTQGSEEVKKMWIRRSNSLMAFCYDCVEESSLNRISKKEFRKKYAEYCKVHKISTKSDFVVKKMLEESYGVGEERTNLIGEMWEWYWVGIKWKEGSV